MSSDHEPPSPIWLLAYEVSIVEAALLTISIEPQGVSEFIEGWERHKYPTGYLAAREAIASAIRREEIPGTLLDVVYSMPDGGGDDLLDGGAGVDTATYAGASGGVEIELKQVFQNIGQVAGTDQLFSIENLIGSTFNDILRGGNEDNRLVGGAGNDTLSGRGGDDELVGGVGNDALNAGGDNDALDGGDGDDTLIGSFGNDALFGGGGNETLNGDDGQDQLLGEAGNDILNGGAGFDRLNGGEGFDVFTGGSGTDWFILSGASFDNDRVTDFEDGVDLIVFRASTGVTEFADITDIRQAGSDVVIETAAGNVRLENTDVADITEAEFIFG